MRARARFDNLVAKYGVDPIGIALEPYLTEKRKERIEQVLHGRVQSLSIAVEESCDVHNVLAGVRSAEAFGVTEIHLINCHSKRSRGRRTTQGAHQWVDLSSHENLDRFLDKRKEVLLAGACVDGAIPLEELPVDRPICLLFGNEHAGLTHRAQKACDMRYKIPMVGMVKSLNLSISIALSLYTFLQRKRAHMGKEGDLTEEQFSRERAYYFLRAIGIEKGSQILQKLFSEEPDHEVYHYG